jgi:peptidoglycan hydrolase-like protein with peptidoglycan-binding domain
MSRILGGNRVAVVPYRHPGLILTSGGAAPVALVRALQRDLRSLGYLRGGVDGRFGPGTATAVRALQHDLLFNDGDGTDGKAPVAMRAFNQDRVTATDGIVDERLAACIEAILDDPRVPKLPRSDTPAHDNQKALEAVRALAATSSAVPIPFLLAVLTQESGLQHFRVPSGADSDDFIVVGLDRNDEGRRDRITSRGYGIGQYTLFHHPPRREEVESVMTDPVLNVGRAVRELREKFDHFVAGKTSGTRADDRVADVGTGPLRVCRHPATDPRFLRDCHACALEVPALRIATGTPCFKGSTLTFRPTEYHPAATYANVPDRAKLGCDWPYAVRRYNGAGVNSYHYQVQVLKRL